MLILTKKLLDWQFLEKQKIDILQRDLTEMLGLFFFRENYKGYYERKMKITSIGRGQAVTSIKCGAGLSPVIRLLFFFLNYWITKGG